MTEGEVLGEEQIRAYLHEVADALPSVGSQHVMVLVGGALLAWHGLRTSTRDVDSASRMDEELLEAVRAVAGNLGLARAG